MSDLEKAHNLNPKREALHLRGLPLFIMSFQTLGIIYSDIGTSPLYVLNGLWPATGPVPPEEDIIGGISAIVWSLLLLPLVKYVFITLYFGTHEGIVTSIDCEGGTFALYQGLFPPAEKDLDADRTLTGDSTNRTLSEHRGRRISELFRWPLLIWCLFGTSLTMADGVFTPAVSVTSAVGGIAVAKPSVTKDIIPISIALLVALFVVQRFGTSKVAFMFAPVAFVWFLLLAGTGIYNITFFPGIFRAFDPSRAVLLFVRTGDYDILAGVLLALTGCEAVFANLGQFTAASIRISFSFFVLPALILAYLGQGARLIVDGEAVLNNMFYSTIPGPQLINQKSFPPIKMVHTSETVQGQIYIPGANWVLMIATIVVVGAFSNLTNLTNAYGFAVATVMFSTSILLAVQIYYVKRWSIFIAVGYFLVFGFFDGLFWGAALKKVPHGAWVPLMFGVILLLTMWLWTWAKSLEDNFDGTNRQNLRHFIQQGSKSALVNAPGKDIDETASEGESVFYYIPGINEKHDPSEIYELERRELQRIPSCAIFHKVAEGKGIPHSFVGFIRQWPALPRVVIFLSVCVVNVARVPAKDRYVVSKVRSVEGFYGVTYYIGFRDNFDVAVNDLIETVCDLERLSNPAGSGPVIEELRAVSRTATHIVPHYHVVSKNVKLTGYEPS
ncbi:hypothetical protein H0H92_008933 [Tricholoma furcatifolium]|nr:hypothetical protein H0H92_008933 [Tricholoma furcatifolium]